jgi:hypothetical protein
LQKLTVPSGWETWGSPPATESSTPPVLYSSQFGLTLSLSIPSSIFGFELEPNAFKVATFTVDFYDGSIVVGTLSQAINGSAGALLYAASDISFSEVVITHNTSDSSPTGEFAIAQVRYNPVPGSLPVLGAAAAFGFSRKLRKRIKTRAQA